MPLSISIGYDASYAWPVEVKIPDRAQPGKFLIQYFTADFQALPTDQARDLVRRADEAREAGRRAEAMDLDKALLRRVVVGWNLAEPFSDSNLELAMRNAYLLTGLNEGYRKSVTGEAVLDRAEGNLSAR